MSGRGIIGLVIGLAVAGALKVFGTIYLVSDYLAPTDPRDPLTKQGGLKSEQDIRKK
jgi:hypothetical protein